jgi:hypothetical protein
VKCAALTSQAVAEAEEEVVVGNPVLRDAGRVTVIQTRPQADIKRASNTIAILMTSAARH